MIMISANTASLTIKLPPGNLTVRALLPAPSTALLTITARVGTGTLKNVEMNSIVVVAYIIRIYINEILIHMQILPDIQHQQRTEDNSLPSTPQQVNIFLQPGGLCSQSLIQQGQNGTCLYLLPTILCLSLISTVLVCLVAG